MDTSQEIRGSTFVFSVGQRVQKSRGYPFPGIVVAAFRKTTGEDRYVVECIAPDVAGILHIFNADQLISTPEV